MRPLEHPVHTTWALQASSGSQSTPAPTAGRSFVLNHLPNSHGQESQDPGPRHLKVEVLPKASLGNPRGRRAAHFGDGGGAMPTIDPLLSLPSFQLCQALLQLL